MKTTKLAAAGLGAVLALALLPISPMSMATAAGDPADIHVYAATPGDTASERFTMTANTVSVFVTKYSNRSNNRVHVARFASTTLTPTIEVTNNAAITSVKIYPERYYPASSYTISGSKVTFDLNSALRYALVEVNGSQPLLAIVNDRPVDVTPAPDPDAANVVDAADYVTDLTGATDMTTQIAAAIDALYNDPTKDTLYFGPGWYQYSGLELRNRTKTVTIYVDEGALLKNRMQPTMEAMEPAIGIWDSANITVSGRGVFDGNGFANYDTSNGGWRHDAATSHHQGGAMIVRSENIVFNDTLLRDAKQWNWETHTAKNVTFNNIKGLTPYTQPWIDGLDLASGQNITVNSALTLGNDDCFASGHYNPDDGFQTTDVWDTEDSFNITLNDTLGWSAGAGNGIRIGHNAYSHALKSYTFNNFNAVGFGAGDNGITIQNSTGTYPRYESIVIKDSSFDTTNVSHNFRIFGQNSSNRIQTVTLSNVWFSKTTADRQASNIVDFTVKRLFIGGIRVTSEAQAAFTESNITNRLYDWLTGLTGPSFTPLANQSVNYGDLLEFTVEVSDDEPGVELEVSGLPTGATFDPATGEFSWTPTQAQVGVYPLTFVATDSDDNVASLAITIAVVDPNLTTEEVDIPVTADAYGAAWSTDAPKNYGDNEYIRMLYRAGSGDLAQDLAGGTSADAKLTYLKFDLTPYLPRLGDIVKAELKLTYFGPTKTTGVCSSCTDTIKVALAGSGWVEGNGKDTTNPYTASTIADSLTWNLKPTVDSTTVVESAPFDVSASAITPNQTNFTNNSVPRGSQAIADVTPLLGAVTGASPDLNLAVNETGVRDIIFVSREGAARNTNPGVSEMYPKLTLTLDTSGVQDLTVEAPTFTQLPPGYTQPAAEPLTITSTSDTDQTIVNVVLGAGAESAFELGTGNNTVAAGGTNTSWTVRPKAGLAQGVYTDTVTVAYAGAAKTATAVVTFTVLDPRSANADLATLTVGGVSVAGFDPAVTDYTYNAGEWYQLPAVTATAADPAATVKVANYWAAATITVTAENPAYTKEYKITYSHSGNCGAVPSPWIAVAWDTSRSYTHCGSPDGTAFLIGDDSDGVWTNRNDITLIYQPEILGVGDSIEAFIAHFDGAGNSSPRLGLLARNDLSVANKNTAKGYGLVVGAPTGTMMQHDSNNNGYIDTESTKVAEATTPLYLKLERTTSTTLTGYYRKLPTDPWSVVGTVTIYSPDDKLDAGLFVSGNNKAGQAFGTFLDVKVPQVVVDKSALEAAIDAAESLDEAEYTAASWAPVAAAVAAAQLVLDDDGATQDEVDAALADLLAALDGLAPLGQKEALEVWVDVADALIDSGVLDVFTDESVQDLLDALEAAQEVLDDPQASQAEVDQA
ncbi:MAG: FIVAR domain-containing protein, partial [Bifidobacteriaceae bacterium]|nr:FIVAR domain-containing protein [Bifidobacteriaceae bacterium]